MLNKPKFVEVNKFKHKKNGKQARDTPDLIIVSNGSMAAQFVFLSPSVEEATSAPWGGDA